MGWGQGGGSVNRRWLVGKRDDLLGFSPVWSGQRERSGRAAGAWQPAGSVQFDSRERKPWLIPRGSPDPPATCCPRSGHWGICRKQQGREGTGSRTATAFLLGFSSSVIWQKHSILKLCPNIVLLCTWLAWGQGTAEMFLTSMAVCRPGERVPHTTWPCPSLQGLGHSRVQPFPQHSVQPCQAAMGSCLWTLPPPFCPPFWKAGCLLFLILNFKPANFSRICKANKNYSPVPS